MKELSIEEKAKRYDKALERAKKINIEHSKCGFKSSDDVLYIFPELVDEIIREEIIDFLRLPHPQFVGKRDHEKWIAWLEKQGEQKSVEEKIKVFIPKFRIGDVVKSISQPMLDSRIIISIDKDCYWTKGGGCIGFAWEKDYELIKQKPTAWSEEDEERYLSCLKILSTGNIEQPETVNTVWLKALKERVQPQPKQEWSEKDENNLICIKRFLHEALLDTNKSKLIYLLDWLDAHYHQKQWKPSDEQMWSLSTLINTPQYASKKCQEKAKELLEQLKKLMEE